jgi:hypothetical protein
VFHFGWFLHQSADWTDGIDILSLELLKGGPKEITG